MLGAGNKVNDPLNRGMIYSVTGRDNANGKLIINHRDKKLQKGIESSDGILAEMTPREWKEFKRHIKHAKLNGAANDEFMARKAAA